MLVRELGVRSKRPRRCEVELALDREAKLATDCRELLKGDVAELGETESEIAEAECSVRIIRIELREELGGVGVRGEELDDGLEIEGVVLPVTGGALRATVLEELLALGGRDEFHERLRWFEADPTVLRPT